MAKYKNILDPATAVFKSLSDPNRLRLFLVLSNQEVCVYHLTALLGLSPSTVSKHLSILKHAGLISSAKKGKWVYYTRTDITYRTMELIPIIHAIGLSFKEDTQFFNDMKSLKNTVC